MRARTLQSGASRTRAVKSVFLRIEKASYLLSAPTRPSEHQAQRNMTVSAAAPAGTAQHSIIADDALIRASAPATPVTSSTVARAHPRQPHQHSVKTIYLIRHGEGWHNIGYDRNYDPHLTPRGWAQTGALQQHLAALQPQLNLQLVVVSPLRRTLETAAGVFGASAAPAALQAATTAGAVSAASAGTASNNRSWVWMHPQVHKPEEVTRRDVIFLPAAGDAASAAYHGSGGVNPGSAGSTMHQPGAERQPLLILAHEGCRERIGTTVCDKFREIPQQIVDFPGVDFSLLQHTTDVDWERLHDAVTHDGGCYPVGEEEAAIERRTLDFYKWLMSRPESRIAVVSHCGFLVHGMRALGKTMLSDAMLQQCNSSNTTTDTPGAQPVDGTCSTGITSDMLADPQQAELLRLTAGDMAGRMAIDFMNCEMRSIQLGWGHDGLHAAGTDVAAKGKPGWLWAAPGNSAEWFPGGLMGLRT